MVESDFYLKVVPVVRFLNVIGKLYVYFFIAHALLSIGFTLLNIDFDPLPPYINSLLFLLNACILPFLILTAIAEYVLAEKGY